MRQAGRLFRKWHRARDGDLPREHLGTSMGPVRREVRKWLEAGARCGQQKTRRACANIPKVERSLWTFLRVEGVEPTNNAAERPLRRAALWRRKSSGTQSASGSRFDGRVLTAAQTLRQQGRDVLEYLVEVCRGMHARLIPALQHETT